MSLLLIIFVCVIVGLAVASLREELKVKPAPGTEFPAMTRRGIMEILFAPSFLAFAFLAFAYVKEEITKEW